MTCEQPVGIILHDNCASAGAQKLLGAVGGCLRAARAEPAGPAGGRGGLPRAKARKDEVCAGKGPRA